MALEGALCQFINASQSVTSIAPSGGYSARELPKDITLPSWSYLNVSDDPRPGRILQTNGTGLAIRRWQIDCYCPGPSLAPAMQLAFAISGVINTFRGSLFDSADNTWVYIDSIFRTDLEDYFDDAPRTYRRRMEFEIWFVETN